MLKKETTTTRVFRKEIHQLFDLVTTKVSICGIVFYVDRDYIPVSLSQLRGENLHNYTECLWNNLVDHYLKANGKGIRL